METNEKKFSVTLGELINAIHMLHVTNGGSTVDIYAGESIKKGFAVGLKGWEMKVSIYSNSCISKYLKENLFIAINQNLAIGTWYNSDDGYTYFDLVKVVDTLEDALFLGRVNDQISIMDLSTLISYPCKARIIPL